MLTAIDTSNASPASTALTPSPGMDGMVHCPYSVFMVTDHYCIVISNL